jgi:hypothetical protein
VRPHPFTALLALACPLLAACGKSQEGGRDAGTLACRAARGVSRAPVEIRQVVELINSLPMPVDLPCFLQSLERPLRVNATVSFISLQRASGQRSPRIFLFSGPLVMSIVPEGEGSDLVEMGQLIDDQRSLKGEVEFPVIAALPERDPFARIRSGDGTTCRFCHPGEVLADRTDGVEAYLSGALRPSFSARVELETLERERVVCDRAIEPERCAILSALFDHGDVLPTDFPPTVPTISGRP